jgi:hypothetical protein
MSKWPGLGYLAASFTLLAAEVPIWRRRRAIGESLVEFWVAGARNASPRTRWLRGPWSSDRLSDPDKRRRLYPWVSLPMVGVLPIVALALLLAGVVRLLGGSR